MLIFSPKFIIEEFLGIPFNRLAVKQLAGLAGKTERTVYNWFSREAIPKRSDFYRIINQIDVLFEGSYEGISYPINSHELIRIFKNPDWSTFATTQIMDEDNAFRNTFVEILRRGELNKVEGKEKNLYLIGNFLPSELISNVQGLSDHRKDSGNGEETKLALLEFVGLLYYLAFAEAEYLCHVNDDKPFLCRKMPRYVDREKGTINTPIEIFFKDWFSKLIERNIYNNKKTIADEIEDWCDLEEQLSAIREMNRMENDATCPSWKTVNEWIEGLLPHEFEGKKVNTEVEIHHAQTLFGGTRILDKSFRKFIVTLHGKYDPVDFFLKLYPHYFNQHMTNIKNGADPEARPS